QREDGRGEQVVERRLMVLVLQPGEAGGRRLLTRGDLIDEGGVPVAGRDDRTTPAARDLRDVVVVRGLIRGLPCRGVDGIQRAYHEEDEDDEREQDAGGAGVHHAGCLVALICAEASRVTTNSHGAPTPTHRPMSA